MKHVYLLKLKQVYRESWVETDLVFQSRANLWIYLGTLWNSWRQTMSEEDFERIPPIPSLVEIRNGLQNKSRHIIFELGFLDHTDPLSIYLTVDKMEVY